MSGVCKICGCTEARACMGGCYWVGADKEYCSQCVYWAALKDGNPYKGILPYDLFPVRTFSAQRAKTACGFAWPIDQRRIAPEALTRLAYAFAPAAGLLPEEFLQEVGNPEDAFAAAIPADKVIMILLGGTVEQAAAEADERLRQIDEVLTAAKNAKRHERAQPGGIAQ